MFTRFAVLAALALFGSASAFVPAPAAARSSALAMSSVPDSAKTVEMMQALVKKGLAEINNISEDQVDAFYAKQSKDNEALVASRSGASDGNMDEQVANVKDMLVNWAPDELFEDIDFSE